MYQTNSEVPNHISTTWHSIILQIRWTSNIVNYITGKNINCKLFLNEQHRRNLAPLILTQAAEVGNTFPENGDNGGVCSCFFNFFFPPQKDFVTVFSQHPLHSVAIPKLEAVWCEFP